MLNPVQQAILQVQDRPPMVPEDVGEPPEGRVERGLKPAPPDTRRYGTLTIEQGQQYMRDEITHYLNDPNPAHMLLIAAPAGIGKTTMLVEIAEKVASVGERVLYVGPRREFYDDLQQLQNQPSWWYNWQPRTDGLGQGVGMTCRYARQMSQWLARGYKALDFCANDRICGWSYMHNDCPYHAQRARTEPIMYVQYEHISLGHPRLETTKLLIGDELPLRAFLAPWTIPASGIVPNMDDSPIVSLMRALRTLVDIPSDEKSKRWSGELLLRGLGGPQRVLEACESSIELLDLQAPDLRHADAVEQAPYGHVLPTMMALKREAEAALAGRPCIERVFVDKKGLTLLGRRIPKELPSHVIWLDATANAEMYQTLFGRPVKVVQPDVALAGTVYQVYASLNNKSFVSAKETDKNAKLSHIKQQVEQIATSRGYSDYAVVSYKDIAAEFGDEQSTAHFHGNRGTNRLESYQALFVIGTPMPNTTDLIQMAAMLYFDREAPFDTTWSSIDRAYAGQPWSYPVSGFWNDPDLQTLLEQFREAELIQSLHRVRPLRRPVDIWLLTNVPLSGIPVQLVNLRELFGAPEGVDPYRWPAVERAALERFAEAGRVTTQDFINLLGVSRRTATKYLDGLIANGWTETEKVASATRGPKVRAIVKRLQPKNR